MLDGETVTAGWRTARAGYTGAEPFPHCAIDDFLPDAVCRQVLEAFPAPTRTAGCASRSTTARSWPRRSAPGCPTRCTTCWRTSTPPTACASWKALTGINGLISDPYFEGGGLHQIEPGGYLKLHTDFNYSKRLRLDRRINLIVYLNEDWREEYNGHLELWDRDVSRCVRKVLPAYNRCVVFNTTDWSYHGHPEKLACPPGRTRKSLALYYYSNGRPEEERSAPHGTMWQERPGVARSKASVFGGLTRLIRKVTGARTPSA